MIRKQKGNLALCFWDNWKPGARFSKVRKLFKCISDDIILFVSSKRRHREARNFAVILNLFPLQHMKRPALQNLRVVVLRMAFRARKFSELSRNGPQACKQNDLNGAASTFESFDGDSPLLRLSTTPYVEESPFICFDEKKNCTKNLNNCDYGCFCLLYTSPSPRDA